MTKEMNREKYESGFVKTCPKCGVRQSYELFIGGRNVCQNCGVKYRYMKTWSSVKEKFWKRNDDFIQKKKYKNTIERDVYEFDGGVTYYCRKCKITQSIEEYMNHKMICPNGHKYIPQYSNYEINDDEEILQ